MILHAVSQGRRHNMDAIGAGADAVAGPAGVSASPGLESPLASTRTIRSTSALALGAGVRRGTGVVAGARVARGRQHPGGIANTSARQAVPSAQAHENLCLKGQV
jgi:hypothetical protein